MKIYEGGDNFDYGEETIDVHEMERYHDDLESLNAADIVLYECPNQCDQA